MMLVNIILAILIFFLYSHFNGKINHLENEIKDLKRRNLLGKNPENSLSEDKITSPTEISEEKTIPEPYLTFRNIKAIFCVNRWYSWKASVTLRYKIAIPPPEIIEENVL